MESLLASRSSNEDVKKDVYLVKGKDHSHEDNTWESYENVVENTKEILEEYYRKNSTIERDGRFSKRTKRTKRKRE